MKIVHLLPALTKGGGEKVAVDLANAAAAAGHQVTVIAGYPVDPTLLRDSVSESVDVRFVSPAGSGRLKIYLDGLFWLKRNARWLAEQDVLHCHLTYGAAMGALARLLRRLRGGERPAIVETYHGVGMFVPTASRWFHSRLATQRDALVLMARDDYWCRFVEARPQLLSEVIPNGVAVPDGAVGDDARGAYRFEAGIPDGAEPVIGTVGQLRADRQPWLYLPIFAELARVLGPKCHFVMAGDGPERGKLEEMVKQYGLDGRVHLPGLAPTARLPIAIMDLYLTLNVGPITGIAALEAAFDRTPIVAIQLIEGRKASPDDWIWSSSDLAEVAAHAAELLGSPDRLKALAENQHAYVTAHHGVDIMAKAYMDLYRRAIARNAQAHSSGNADADQ
jgi:glycosyltransferase involved in cell wall biosynthesis